MWEAIRCLTPLKTAPKRSSMAIICPTGEFRAEKIQAKCASKYQAAPGSQGAGMKAPVAALSSGKISFRV